MNYHLLDNLEISKHLEIIKIIHTFELLRYS